jgi:Galactose oxidase, central domain
VVVNRMGVTKLLLALVLVASGSGLLVVAQARQDVGTWAPAGVVADSRSGAAAVVLKDGRTLIAGGLVAGAPTDSVVVYDPVTHGITLAGQLLAARVGHTATLLEDGRVLVAGGQVGDTVSADIEVFDPVLGSSTLLGQMAQPRTRHAAARIDRRRRPLRRRDGWRRRAEHRRAGGRVDGQCDRRRAADADGASRCVGDDAH